MKADWQWLFRFCGGFPLPDMTFKLFGIAQRCDAQANAIVNQQHFAFLLADQPMRGVRDSHSRQVLGKN